jgi:hypothetical protein
MPGQPQNPVVATPTFFKTRTYLGVNYTNVFFTSVSFTNPPQNAQVYGILRNPGNYTDYGDGTTRSFNNVGPLNPNSTYTLTLFADSNIPENAVTLTVTTGAMPVLAPDAPTDVTAVAGNGSATVSWTAPASDRGAAITGYRITPSIGTIPYITVGNVLTTTFTGLTNDISISFSVQAINSIGNGDTSAPSNSVTPSASIVSATAPGAPTGLTAVAGINSATLSWNAPASDGGSAITGYTLTTPVAAPVTVGNVLTTTLTGLISDGRPYTYTIQAINAVGVSAYSVEADTVYPLPPVTTPGAPTNVVALAGNGTVTVSWLAPASNGGATITSYIVVPSVGSSQDVGNALTATFSVANGTPVTFTVKAVNSAGSSPSSTASASVTPNPAATAPGAPRNVTVVAGANSATVSWAAPLSDGGSPVTGYVITPSIGSAVTVGNVLTATITGLASGTAITFTVTAINAIGGSPNPPTTTPVTPTPTITVPGAPRNLTVIAGANSAIVSWDAPLSNGGSPITGYTVTPSVGSPVTVGNVLTATLTGLAGGISVTFTVVAINSAGGSSNPPTTTPVTPTAPGAGPPSSVLGVTGIPGVGSAIISWSPPISNGGSPITGYKVICVPDNKRPNLAGPNDRSLEVRGLKNGMPVVFTVVALNAYGQSDSIVLTPNTLPSMPVVTAVRGGSGTINLIWKAKQNPTNPITSYLVTLVSPLPAPQSMVLPTPLVTATGGSVSISGLINGNSYVFLVQSVASIGRSVGGLSKAIIAASLPNPPTSFSGITAVSSAWLTWVAPTNTGGLPITGYTIIYSVFGVIKIVNVKLVTAVIIKGLTNGTAYSFTIQTNTSAGASTPTAPVIVTPSLTI